MRRVVMLLIICISAIVLAQSPSTVPASSPVGAGPDTAPTQPVTLPTTGAFAATMPSTRSSFPSLTTAMATGSASTSYTLPAGNGHTVPSAYTPGVASDGPDLTPKAFPRQYASVLTRSVFMKGSQRVYDSYREPGSYPVMLNTGATTTYAPTTAFSPEGMLVFNGASDVDGQVVAFIENTGLNQITRYHVGDLVNQGTSGRVTAITLDSLDYTAGGRVTHVLIGQNLAGVDTSVLTTQPVDAATATSPGTGPTTAPSGAVNDVLERLRQRRLKELGG